MGTSRLRAAAKASGPQAYQSTGLCACWRRYGLVSLARRLGGRASGWRDMPDGTERGPEVRARRPAGR